MASHPECQSVNRLDYRLDNLILSVVSVKVKITVSFSF